MRLYAFAYSSIHRKNVVNSLTSDYFGVTVQISRKLGKGYFVLIYYLKWTKNVKFAKILAMIQLEQKTAPQIAESIAKRVQKRRKERHFTQAQLAERAGMSFASYKRFEQKHEIAFDSIIKIAIALGCEKDFENLFATPQFSSIEELIASEKN